MTAACEKVHAFADGELPEEEVTGFQRHLPACPSCRSELRDVMMLDAVIEETCGGSVAELRSMPKAGATRPPRRRGVWVAIYAAAAAIAIAFAVSRGENAVELLAAGESRPLAARLAHPAADVYRPLRVVRGESRTASVPFRVLARLEREGDFRSLATAFIMMNDPARANGYLDRSPRTSAIENDRAVVAMEQGRWADAAAALRAILVNAPDHPQALWNLGLALERLGQPADAAAALERVASLGEPGWAAEARERGLALREGLAAERR